jgi:hypothetical protein
MKRGDAPAASNTGFHTIDTDTPSGFVKSSVSTSFGFASKKVLTFVR